MAYYSLRIERKRNEGEGGHPNTPKSKNWKRISLIYNVQTKHVVFTSLDWVLKVGAYAFKIIIKAFGQGYELLNVQLL